MNQPINTITPWLRLLQKQFLPNQRVRHPPNICRIQLLSEKGVPEEQKVKKGFQPSSPLKSYKHKHIVEMEYYVDRKGDYQSGTCIAECTYSPEFGGRTETYELKVNN